MASSIIRKAARSALWMFANAGFSAVLGLISMMVLARLLGPEVYGAVGLASMLYGITYMFSGPAFTESLKQREQLEDGHSDAIFWLNTGITGLVAIGFFCLTPMFGNLFNSQMVANILPVIALSHFIRSLGAVPESLIERSLDYQKLIWLGMGLDVPMLAFTIILALLGFGVWALVLSSLVSAIISTIFIWKLARWKPGFQGQRKHLQDLFKFNRDTIVLSILSYFDGALPRFALGFWFGERAVGIYDISISLAGRLSGLIMGPFSELAMTVTSRLQDDRAKIRELLDHVYGLTTIVVYPAAIGACVIAPIALPFILGDKWHDAILPAQIALLMGLRHATGDFNFSILRGVGNSLAPTVITAIGIAVLIVFAPVLLPYGAAGAVGLVALRIFTTWPISAYQVEKAIGYPCLRQFIVGWQSLLASLLMAAAVLAAYSVLPTNGTDLVNLGLLITVGVAAYVITFVLFWPQKITALGKLLKGFRSSNYSLELPDAAPVTET